jgi:hypothetical protein
MKCCICKIPVVHGWDGGNNAEPVVEDGRCCDVCNSSVVIPVRLGDEVLLKSVRAEIVDRERGKKK